MDSYYVLFKETDFKVIYMEPASAELWIRDGWEVRCCETNQLAQDAVAQWKGERRKSPLALVARNA